MNLPNLLTLSRLPLLFCIVVFLLYFTFPGSATLALLLFILASITDWLDGKLARSRGLVSNFGKLMDALTDKVLILGIFMTFFQMPDSLLPGPLFPLLLLVLCREFLVTGLRLVAAGQGVILGAEKGGKQKMATQITAAICLLVHHAARTDLRVLLPDVLIEWIGWLGIACFVLAAILAISSGFRYLYKYWDVFVASENSGTRP